MNSYDWKSADPEAILFAINEVFRTLLANLLNNIDNPRFRMVRAKNTRLLRCTSKLSDECVVFLFGLIGFHLDSKGEVFNFDGNRETVKEADKQLSAIEAFMKVKRGDRPVIAVPSRAAEREAEKAEILKEIREDKVARLEEREEDVKNSSPIDYTKDYGVDEATKDVVKKTLLKTGRIRNSFFEGKDFTTRRMSGGMVYACGTSETCNEKGIEAHWHLETSKNGIYSFIVHLNAEGTVVSHMGPEYGYQYNTLPGTKNFGKVVLFSEKLVTPDGKLLYVKHPETVVESCIYCGAPFSRLMFT